MDIFGLEPILAAVIITLVGAGLQFALGYLKSDDSFDVKRAISTALTTTVVGIVAVATTLGALSEEAADTEVLIADCTKFMNRITIGVIIAISAVAF
ncbi:MAG: hypothetical protein OER82_02075 [Nitrosopumilus sp.]|nr:hypothetical protein [Nitrosopumilus sp.]